MRDRQAGAVRGSFKNSRPRRLVNSTLHGMTAGSQFDLYAPGSDVHQPANRIAEAKVKTVALQDSVIEVTNSADFETS